MRIGIYVEVAKDKQPTGIGLHVRNLVQSLADLDDENEYLLYYQQNLLGRSGGFPHRPDRANFRLRPVRFPGGWLSDRPRLWWDWYLPRVLRRDRIDVFHGPNHFLPAFDPRRNVVTIHDVAYFRMDVHGAGVNAVMREWTEKSLRRASAVIALSENTRRDVEELGVPPERIRVIYGGGHVVPEDQIAYHRQAELRQLFNLDRPYVLFVGTLQPRKNVPFLLRAFARLKQERGLPHRLVLAGHRDTAAAEINALIKELGLAQDVTITGYVEPWQLPLLYKMADLFVLPTRYEGFTLVTLEAMAYGVPVIATDTSSLREGVGDAALLVEVDDVESLARAMKDALTDDNLRRDLITRGQARAPLFTWERCARETLELYEETARNAQQEPALERAGV
jgi:glycosyltransferase involved in cell wall biosynthesis